MADDKYRKRIEASMKLDIDLYRGGNSMSPRFNNVRDKDIAKFAHERTGETWVKGMSGGISTFTAPERETNWWWIRAGTVIPKGLVVTRDTTDKNTGITHYTIHPAEDMSLVDYVDLMQSMLKADKLTLEQAIEHRSRWTKT